VQILGISGSLQVASANTALLRVATRLAPAGTRVALSESVGALPHFNPDLDGEDVDGSVTRFRAQLAAADGVLVASPEYAHEMPGSLKNALDWVVGSGELYERAVAVTCASPRPNGGVNVRAALEQTLRAQGACIVASVTVPVPTRLDTDDAIASDPAIRDAIGEVLAAFPG
jgi:NAD(P)H-dependent FMN reductase